MEKRTALTNVADLLFQWEARDPFRTAIIDGSGSMTYYGLIHIVRQCMTGFTRLGLRRGDRLGLMLHNELAFIVGYFAGLAMGLRVVPLNYRLTGPELDRIIEFSEIQALITSAECSAAIAHITSPSLQWIAVSASEDAARSSFTTSQTLYRFETLWLDPTRPEAVKPVHVDIRQEPAVIIHTSGTTGTPKGVMLSHLNLFTDVLANTKAVEATSKDTFITVSPMFHVFGQVNVLLTAFGVGAPLVLQRKFSPKTTLENIEKHQVTFLAAVPTMYQMMLPYLGEHRYNLSSLRVCHSGAAPMPVEIFNRVEAAFAATVQEGYGLSEATSIVASNPLHGSRKPGSIGLPLPGIEMKVVNEDMLTLPEWEIGEICVRGETVMLGYLNDPAATQKKVVDGWLKTGDMGYTDGEGYFYVVDREDDLINVGGAKVYPREVEEVLYRHEDIEAAAVVGVASELYTQTIKAYVVPKPHALGLLDKPQLQRHCRESLADYKIPKVFEFLTEIPKSSTGKVLKAQLRSQHPLTHAAAAGAE